MVFPRPPKTEAKITRNNTAGHGEELRLAVAEKRAQFEAAQANGRPDHRASAMPVDSATER
jgi:hypothetical protein